MTAGHVAALHIKFPAGIGIYPCDCEFCNCAVPGILHKHGPVQQLYPVQIAAPLGIPAHIGDQIPDLAQIRSQCGFQFGSYHIVAFLVIIGNVRCQTVYAARRQKVPFLRLLTLHRSAL